MTVQAINIRPANVTIATRVAVVISAVKVESVMIISFKLVLFRGGHSLTLDNACKELFIGLCEFFLNSLCGMDGVDGDKGFISDKLVC